MARMKILISITSYQARHSKYLSQVLQSCKTEFADCNPLFVLSVDYAFDIPAGIDYVFLPKQYDGWSYTWNNKQYLKENYAGYDYILETDDDVLVTRAVLDYYIAFSAVLSDEYIPGILTKETDKQGNDYLLTLNRHAKPKDPRITIGAVEYLAPFRLHSAAFIADRERYAAIAGQTMPATSGKYSIPQASRTLIYNQFKKVIPIANIADKSALVHHLPNRFINQWYAQPTKHSDFAALTTPMESIK